LILISGHSAPEGRNFTSALQLSFSFIDQPYFFKLMQLCFQSWNVYLKFDLHYRELLQFDQLKLKFVLNMSFRIK
jgi:hypothetical protein